jgi:uncharacterized RDD family membrane protein YckC
VALRILGLAVDLLCLQAVIYLFAFALGGLLQALQGAGGEPAIGGFRALTVFVLLGGAFAYYWIFEAALGKTPGKIVTRTRVMTPEGQRPSPRAILIRSLARFIPFEWVSFLNRNPVGWHDSLSGTMVVEDRTLAAKPS